MPAAAHARTRSKPGSLMPGRARIAHQRDRSTPLCMRDDQLGAIVCVSL